MRETRLLERIARWENADRRSASSDVEMSIASISGHVQRILNTRQGSVLIQEDFGIPDFANVAGSMASGSTRDIERTVSETLTKYEPRLKSPKVVFLPKDGDLLSLQFELTAEMDVDNRRVPIHFQTSISAEGKVQIKR